MTISKTTQGDKLVLQIEGRIDTTTAPQLQDPLLDALGSYAAVLLDFTNVSYVSSAGLRVLMVGQKYSAEHGKKMALTGVIDEIMEVFEMTGFSDILTIE